MTGQNVEISYMSRLKQSDVISVLSQCFIRPTFEIAQGRSRSRALADRRSVSEIFLS